MRDVVHLPAYAGMPRAALATVVNAIEQGGDSEECAGAPANSSGTSGGLGSYPEPVRPEQPG